MALTPTIKGPQAGAIVTLKSITPSLRVPQANAMVPYNVPAKKIGVTFGGFNVPINQTAAQIRTTQANLMVVIKGTVDNPKLRSWFFTLDDHDFWVLKLGTYFKTLVFDLQTNNWFWWSSDTQSNWRSNVGLNWRSSGGVPFKHGTNVIVGDDSSGVLWVLDPQYGLDDAILTTDPAQTFLRVATGQMTTVDREYIPIYSATLDCVAGYPALTPDSVTLKYSDDNGVNYTTAIDPQVSESANFNQEFQWLSLGRFRSPGRIFQIVDNGGVGRIDALDINSGNTKGS